MISLGKDILGFKGFKSFFNKNFLRNENYPNIEVLNNTKTTTIFNDNNESIILNFMSINDNNYPKIHILPWNGYTKI